MTLPWRIVRFLFVLVLPKSPAIGFLLNLKRSPMPLKYRISSTLLFNFESSKDSNMESFVRRKMLRAATYAAIPLFSGVPPANAKLVQFPCQDGLMNTYHLMRAGESKLEEEHVLGTNPVLLTNRDNALSDLGKEQVHLAAKHLESLKINPSVVKFPLAANAMDTADILANELHIGRNRLVPEYTYMDQRGVGAWDMMDLQSTQDAVWALDVQQAGSEGLSGHPPSNDDGTPNETLGNQVTRLRQLVSLLESFLSGDEILLIFPDGTSPALMSALFAGVPLSRVHEMHFEPGEVRLNVNYHSVLSSWPTTPSNKYTEAIARGEEQLSSLKRRSQQLQNSQTSAEAVRIAKKEAALEKKEASRRASMEKARAEAATHADDSSFAGMSLLGGLGVLASISSNENHTEATFDKQVIDAEDNTLADQVTGESFPELGRLENLIETAPIHLPDEKTCPPQSINRSKSSLQWTATKSPTAESDAGTVTAPMPVIEEVSVEPAPRASRTERAQAMDAYIEDLGGGDAWLGALSEIANEEDA